MHAIANLRQDYHKSELLESDALPNAIDQFQLWFDQALTAKIVEPNIMTLATVSEQGQPSARIVLLKGLDQGDFVFYTNYQSAKADDIQANPKVALLFFWEELERQIRIEGTATQVSRDMSEAYFHSRPIASQVGALASHQSQVVASRKALDDKMEALLKEYENKPVPLPRFWGGYRVTPTRIEFWQGRTGRLHDRLRYTRTSSLAQPSPWYIERLNP